MKWATMISQRKTGILLLLLITFVVNFISLFYYYGNLWHKFLLEDKPFTDKRKTEFKILVQNRSSSSDIHVRKTLSMTMALKARRLDKMWDVWKMKYIINKPFICVKTPELKRSITSAVILVVSSPGNQDRRVAIRKTWGSSLPKSFQLLFFVGRTAKDQPKLLLEDEIYRDIIQVDIVDHYDNLTLKSVLLFRWVTTYCSSARFVSKIDDDVFLHVKNFQEALRVHASLGHSMFGQLAHMWQPIRNRDSHYFVAKAGWSASIYPDFLTGPAYVVSQEAAVKLLAQVSSLPFFYLEDVYVTGMCAAKAGIQRFNHNGFFHKKHPINPCLFHRLVTFHHLEADQLLATWDILHTYSANDSGCYETRCTVYRMGLCTTRELKPVDYYKLWRMSKPHKLPVY